MRFGKSPGWILDIDQYIDNTGESEEDTAGDGGKNKAAGQHVDFWENGRGGDAQKNGADKSDCEDHPGQDIKDGRNDLQPRVFFVHIKRKTLTAR